MEDVILEPPLYFAEDHIFDISFHPKNDILAASLING
jgi:WD repeat-containing protein 55